MSSPHEEGRRPDSSCPPSLNPAAGCCGPSGPGSSPVCDGNVWGSTLLSDGNNPKKTGQILKPCRKISKGSTVWGDGLLTCGVIPHQKLEYAPWESSMGAMTDLFSAISRLRVSGLVRMLSVSANWHRHEIRKKWTRRLLFNNQTQTKKASEKEIWFSNKPGCSLPSVFWQSWVPPAWASSHTHICCWASVWDPVLLRTTWRRGQEMLPFLNSHSIWWCRSRNSLGFGSRMDHLGMWTVVEAESCICPYNWVRLKGIPD